MYTIKDENGNFLKYVFKDKIIFNGAENSRSIVVYTCKKMTSAENLLAKCIDAGFKHVSIVEVTDNDIDSIPKPKAPTKENKVRYLSSITKDELDTYYGEYDETLFNELHPQCVACSRSCKQASIATIIKCPQYSPI